jgi:hypothetical protein
MRNALVICWAVSAVASFAYEPHRPLIDHAVVATILVAMAWFYAWATAR